MNIYTIGYASRTLKEFIDALKKHNITALADVRSLPYSAYFPMFNREDLSFSLKEHGIKYVYLGHMLGPRSKDENDYLNNQVQFKKLQSQAVFKKGISRILNGSNKGYSIAMMCAEKESLTCHRNLLIGEYLLNKENINIKHILFNKEIETQEESMKRLCDTMMMIPDMFKDFSSCIDEAYENQCLKFAYRKPKRN